MSQSSDPTDQPALQQALEDICTKLAYYNAIAKKHGWREPLTVLIASCRQQQEAFLWLSTDKTEGTHDATSASIVCTRDWLESLETAVTREIDSFDLYQRLLQEDLSPQLRDTLYRIQAAVCQHHLPALRREISCVQAADPMALIEDIKEIIEDQDAAQWARLFSGRQGSLLGGALLGAGAFWLAKEQLNRKTEKE